MQTILLSEIKILDRIRKDLGSLLGLKDSISRHGVLQPIIIDENHNLIAGERRYRCCEQLGITSIPFLYRRDLPEEIKEEIEFEENFFRKAFTWQEECLGVLKIYERKKNQDAIQGFTDDWRLIISEMFGVSISTISYILIIAQKLRAELKLDVEKRRYHKFGSCYEAYRVGFLQEEQDRLEKILANQPQTESIESCINEENTLEQTTDESKFEGARKIYEANPLNTIPFDEYLKEKESRIEDVRNRVHLSETVIRGDSIEYMLQNPKRFDHIITDIPYGIDVSYLTIAHGGSNKLDRIEDQHSVEGNKNLFVRFFPAAFSCTKDHSFVITCCDIEHWHLMKQLAEDAGFAVQGWPYVWRKNGGKRMNSAAMYNTTKDYELVMICRKPSAVLTNFRNTSFTDASNTDVITMTGHPFAKPFELTKDLCEMVSSEGQTILEPFAGGGSMVIQMLRMRRNVVAVELEEHFYNSLVENVKREHYLKVNPKTVFK